MQKADPDFGEVAQVWGIPISWLHEIDAACDAFFARRGMAPPTPVRDQIRGECRAQSARRDARDQQSEIRSQKS
jgi:hypothetical protein